MSSVQTTGVYQRAVLGVSSHVAPHCHPMSIVQRVGDDMAGDAGSDFGRHLRALRQTRGLSLKAVAEAAGIDHSRLSRIERGVNPPPSRSDSRDTVLRLAQVLGEDPQRLLELAGQEPRSNERTVRQRPSFRELILTEPTLTGRQKAALLNVYDVLMGSASSSDTSS